MSRQSRSVLEHLKSPLRRGLGQSVEVLGQAIHSDIAATCVFGPDQSDAPGYVSVRNLRLTASQRAQLLRWPRLSPSIFTAMRDRTHAVPACRLDPGDISEGALLHTRLAAISPGLTPVDGLGLHFSLDSHSSCPLVFLRCGHSEPFNNSDVEVVSDLRDELETILRQSHKAQAAARYRADGVQAEDHLKTLSPTERQIFDLLVHHHTERHIAASLDRSPHTVHVHVKNIYRKLRVNSRKQLAAAFDSEK